MSEYKIVKTFYGHNNIYEVVRKSGGLFNSPEYQIDKNGHFYRGHFVCMRAAIEAALKESGKWEEG